MFKPMIVATAVLAIVGSSTVYAQPCGHGDARFEQQYRPSADDVRDFTDARIAAPGPAFSSRRSRKRTGRRSNRPCATWSSCGLNECRPVRLAV